MRAFKIKRARFVLATLVALSLGAQTSRAEPKDASELKFGDVRTLAQSSYYSALSLFTLTAATHQQKILVVERLKRDGSPKALDALAEIAASAENPAIARLAFEELLAARPASFRALRIVEHLSYSESRKEEAKLAVNDLAHSTRSARPTIPLDQQLDSLNMKFAQDLLNEQATDLKRKFQVPEDLSNGSRYFIQTWFLKKILSLQHASDDSRLIRLNFLINEISIYLAKAPRRVKIDSPKALEAFKASLMSRYAYLQDEMNYSKGLSDQTPVSLEIAPEMRDAVRAFSDSFRQFDQKLTMLNDTNFFDLLCNHDPVGLVFRIRLKAQTDLEKLAQLKLISDEFQKQYLGLQTVAPKLIDSKAIQFANPAEQRFFELLISHYFSVYSFEETANVMKAIIERPDKQSGTDLFHLMVMYAGPQMQKLLQVVGRRPGISPELSATFRELEESGLPSPWERVGRNFELPPVGYHWVSLERDARVGSMAETYKGFIRDNSDHEYTIAARTLKSEIRERVEREIPRLEDLGRVLDNDPVLRQYDFPLVGPVMDDVMSMSRSERDVELTTQSQKTGERVYTATKILKGGVTVRFKTAKTLISRNGDVIYSTWLPGGKFEDFVKREPDLAAQVAEATVYHWIENALFKEFFFHADLHQGNIKVLKTGPGDYTVSLLDFGMVGRLRPEERSVIIKLSLASSSNSDPSLIVKYLYQLSEPGQSTISSLALQAAAREYLKTNPPLR